MRRTTICRSRAAIAFAAASFGLAAPALAQNPPSQPAPQQQPAPAARDTAPATPLSQLPATHIVDRGETLWGLARQYFGDPLLWPEIYRLNTDVVEDPHWIFPGEELRITAPAATQVALAPVPTADTTKAPAATDSSKIAGVTVTPGTDTTHAAPPAPAPTPVVYGGSTIFSAANRPSVVQQTQTLEIRQAQAYRALRPGEIYSAAFLTEGRDLHTGKLLGTVQGPNIQRLTTVTTALLYNQVAFDPPPGDTLHPGDLLLALDRSAELRGWGDLVKPSGLLRVESVDSSNVPHHATARVIELYRQIHDGQEVLPITPFQQAGNERAAAVSGGLSGHVLGIVTPADIVGVQSEILVDKGAQDSVRLGDIFQISGTDRSRPSMSPVLTQAEGMVVNVQQKSCTLKLINVSRPDVRAGSVAQLVRRMPS